MDLKLAGRVALVSGASRGIGRATALAFAAEGANVAIGFRADEAAAQAVAQAARDHGVETLTVRMDLAEDSSLDRAVELVADRLGRLDVLVNNAGTFPTIGPFPDQLDGQVRQALRSNYEGPARLIQRAAPVMRREGFGRIVNVSTVHAQDGVPNVVAHTASKSALHGLTRSLARELGPDGILVNAVLPGLTLTEAVLDRFPADRMQAQAAENPTRRNSRPEDLARLIVFLGSPANAYISGELIRHNGGG